MLLKIHHFKTIFSVNLDQFREPYVWRDLKYECTETSPVLPMNGYFKTKFWGKLQTQRALCSRRPEQLTCRISVAIFTDKHLFQDHLHSRTQLTWITLFPGRPEQWMSWVFPSVTNVWHLQDTFWVKFYQLEELCLPGDLNNENIVFSRVTDEWPYQDPLPTRTPPS